MNCPKSFCFSSTNTHLILPPPQTHSLLTSHSQSYSHTRTHFLKRTVSPPLSDSHTQILSYCHPLCLTLPHSSYSLIHSFTQVMSLTLLSLLIHSFIRSERVHMTKPMSYRHYVLYTLHWLVCWQVGFWHHGLKSACFVACLTEKPLLFFQVTCCNILRRLDQGSAVWSQTTT